MLNWKGPINLIKSNSHPCAGQCNNHTILPRQLSKHCLVPWPLPWEACSSAQPLWMRNLFLISNLNVPWISFALLPQVLSFLGKCFLNWISKVLFPAALSIEVGHHLMLIPFLIIRGKQHLCVLSMSPDPASIEHTPSFSTLYSRGHPCSAKLSFCLICLICDIWELPALVHLGGDV